MEKKLLSEQHTYTYEVVDKHGTHIVSETQTVDHEESDKSHFGFRNENKRVQKVQKGSRKS